MASGTPTRRQRSGPMAGRCPRHQEAHAVAPLLGVWGPWRRPCSAPWLGGAPARQAASPPPGGPRGGGPARRPVLRHPCSAPTWRRPCSEGGVGGGGLCPTRRRVVCSTCSTAPFIRARAQEPREGRIGSLICGDLASEKLRPRPCAAPWEGRRHPCITRAITSFCPHLTVTLTADSRNGIEGIEVKILWQ